jgi:hypothetical protein
MGLPPVTYSQLAEGTHSPQDGMEAMKFAIGETIWARAYPPPRIVSPQNFVPAQFAAIVSASSAKLHQDVSDLMNDQMANEAHQRLGRIADDYAEVLAKAQEDEDRAAANKPASSTPYGKA